MLKLSCILYTPLSWLGYILLMETAASFGEVIGYIKKVAPGRAGRYQYESNRKSFLGKADQLAWERQDLTLPFSL